MIEGWQPEEKFPFVGPEGNRLYRVGLCQECGLLLMSTEAVRRDFCHWHDPEVACKTPSASASAT